MKSKPQQPARKTSKATGSGTRVHSVEPRTTSVTADYRLLIENLRYGILVLGDDRRLLMANQTATTMLGGDWEKLADKDILEFVHPDCRKDCSGLFSTGKRPGHLPETVELQLIPSTGGCLPVDVSSAPIRWSERDAVLVTVHDVTKRKQIEQSLRDGESAWRALVDLIPYPVNVKDSEGRFLLVNPAMARLAGRTTDALIGRNLSVLLANPEDLERIRQDDLEVINSGRPAFVAAEPVRDAQGVMRIIQSYKVPISFPGLGQPAVLGVLEDITDRKRMEEELRREHAQLLALFDSIDEVIYVTDPVRNEILFVNQSMKRQFGKDPTGGICFREFQGLDSPCDFCTNDIILQNKGIPYVWEHHNPLVGRDYLITDKSIVWPDGRDVRFEIARDITDRKRAEIALRESEDRYRDLVENLNEVVYVISDTGRLTYANAAMQSVFGYSPDELLGRSITEAMHPDDIPKFRTAFAEVIGGQRRSNEYRFTAKDGSEKWMLTSSYPHFEYGRIAGVRGVCSDITERKALELRLQESEAAFRALAETAGEGIVVVDAQRRVLYSNPQARSMLGVSAEDFSRKDMRDFLVHEEFEDAAIRFREVLGGKRQPQRGVQTFIDSHGESLKVEIISARIKWYGQEALLTMFHDVTDRLRMEEELRCHQENLERKLAERTEYIRRIEHRQAEFEKLAAISGLAARIAHEINNPLGGVKNAFHLMKDEISPDAPHAKYIPMIEKEIDRMKRIIRELYTLYRPGPEPTGSFGVAMTLGEVVSLLEAEAYAGGIRMEMDVKPPDSTFFGSEDAVRQILFNLSKNAIEASPPGAVVSVQAIVEEDGLHLSVSDQGTGIADDVRPRLFEPFFSIKPSRGTTGLGLGLPVSKTLVETLGGSLDFETTVGEGTIFHVWLPSGSVGGQEG